MINKKIYGQLEELNRVVFNEYKAELMKEFDEVINDYETIVCIANKDKGFACVALENKKLIVLAKILEAFTKAMMEVDKLIAIEKKEDEDHDVVSRYL